MYRLFFYGSLVEKVDRTTVLMSIFRRKFRMVGGPIKPGLRPCWSASRVNFAGLRQPAWSKDARPNLARLQGQDATATQRGQFLAQAEHLTQQSEFTSQRLVKLCLQILRVALRAVQPLVQPELRARGCHVG